MRSLKAAATDDANRAMHRRTPRPRDCPGWRGWRGRGGRAGPAARQLL